jgi:replicative DNA helicase
MRDVTQGPDAPEMMLRVPPHSVEAETGLLGGLLMQNNAWERVSDIVVEADFYHHEHRLIYTAIVALVGACKVADVITVFEHLKSMGRADEVGGLIYLNALAHAVASASGVRRYAEIVRERSILRHLAAAGDEIATTALNTEGRTVDALLDEAQHRIMKIAETGRKSDDWVGIYEGMTKHTQVLEERAEGKLQTMGTGLSDLDEYLEGGLRPGELVIVGARPSMGKTALGLTIGVHLAQVFSVGLLSMEMSHCEVNDRLTAMLGSVSLSAVKCPQKGEGLNWTRVVEGVDRARDLRLHTSDQGGLNINQVRSKARNLKRMHGLDVLIVDYIGLMSGLDAKANRNAQLEEISRGLKALAKELGICVLCMAQLNRKSEERPDQMPMMSDLRDSGAIEQDADVILFIKRPIMANPNLDTDWQHYAKLSVAKNRQGRCGYLHLRYMGEHTKFSGWAGDPPCKENIVQWGRGL